MNASERFDYHMSNYERFNSEYELDRYNARFGYHFFDADSKRFFNSRIGSIFHGVSPANWNIFITSERYQNEPREYTVRQLLIDGSVKSLSEFQQYTSAAQAKRAIEKYLKDGTAF